MFSSAVASAIRSCFAWRASNLSRAEKEAGTSFVYGIPLWTVQTILPLGFAVIGLRLLRHSAETWRGRFFAGLFAATLLAAGAWLPFPDGKLAPLALGLLLTATVLGAPVFVTLGGAGLILFWGKELPLAAIPVEHYRLVINPTLPTIPLFTLAGYFLAEGGASRRLVRVFQALVGHVRGGPAIATALVCAFFTSFTGASGVTILALGGLLMPVLVAAKYSEKIALGLLTGPLLGLLLPPACR